MDAHQRVITDSMTAIIVIAVNGQLLLIIWPICLIIICMDAHQHVITDCMTMSANISLCLAIRIYTSVYILHTKQFFSIFFPCCATFAILKHVQENTDPGDNTCVAVERLLYVDNYLQSVSSADKVSELVCGSQI